MFSFDVCAPYFAQYCIKIFSVLGYMPIPYAHRETARKIECSNLHCVTHELLLSAFLLTSHSQHHGRHRVKPRYSAIHRSQPFVRYNVGGLKSKFLLTDIYVC